MHKRVCVSFIRHCSFADLLLCYSVHVDCSHAQLLRVAAMAGGGLASLAGINVGNVSRLPPADARCNNDLQPSMVCCMSPSASIAILHLIFCQACAQQPSKRRLISRDTAWCTMVIRRDDLQTYGSSAIALHE